MSYYLYTTEIDFKYQVGTLYWTFVTNESVSDSNISLSLDGVDVITAGVAASGYSCAFLITSPNPEGIVHPFSLTKSTKWKAGKVYVAVLTVSVDGRTYTDTRRITDTESTDILDRVEQLLLTYKNTSPYNAGNLALIGLKSISQNPWSPSTVFPAVWIDIPSSEEQRTFAGADVIPHRVEIKVATKALPQEANLDSNLNFTKLIVDILENHPQLTVSGNQIGVSRVYRTRIGETVFNIDRDYHPPLYVNTITIFPEVFKGVPEQS